MWYSLLDKGGHETQKQWDALHLVPLSVSVKRIDLPSVDPEHLPAPVYLINIGQGPVGMAKPILNP